MYRVDIGNHGFILGILYLFKPLIVVGIVLLVIFLIGRHYYKKYQEKQANAPLLIRPQESLIARIINWLNS
jgi:hypothetical protein